VKVISMALLLVGRDTPVIWRGPLKIKAIKQMMIDVNWGDLDFMVIDLPPGTSDEPLSIAQEIPDADGAVVITTPQEVSLLDVRKSIAFAQAVRLPILGVVENMSGFVCPHCGKNVDVFKRGGGEAAAKELGLPFLGRIPLDPQIVIGGDAGKPFVLEHPNSPAAKAMAGDMRTAAAAAGRSVERRLRIIGLSPKTITVRRHRTRRYGCGRPARPM